MKIFLLPVALCLLTLTSFAQNFTFGQITYENMDFDRKTIDSTANAVVLKEFGTASIQKDDNTGQLELIFEYHTKIKIYNKNGFTAANVVIPMYKDENREEIVIDLKASTFNYINGNFVETVMDKKAIFIENRSKYTRLTKFTLPNLKEGSVIEYSYRLKSPRLFNFKTWEFQSDLPKVWSEYQVYIPGIYNYNVSLKGYQKLTDQKVELSKDCLRFNGVSIDCSKITYLMKDIPAFLEEENMTAPSNFKSAIYFELSDFTNPNGAKTSYTKTWKDVDYELTSDKSFGSQMKRKDVYKDLLATIIKDAPDDLQKAQAIYAYIKKQIKWNNYYGIFTEDNIKKSLETRSGSIADINLNLIAALSAANLDAEAVILSTRENGNINKLYPVISDFNYVVAKVNIGDKSYLLDASEPLLPFGLLPLRCINDKGRVINLKKASYWMDLKASQKNTTSYILQGKLNPDGKLTGLLTTYSQGYAAYNKRKDIMKYGSIDEYVEKIDERLPRIKIKHFEISNVDSIENALTEKYEVEFTMIDGTANKQFYLSPFFINTITKNPFNLNERTYPVDLGAATDERISIQITMPDQYEVLEKPKDMAMGLPDSGGRYLLNTSFENNTLSLTQALQLNKAIYEPEQYLYLKEFYSKIIQTQKSEYLLKKAN
ncbi:uncharacterized protein DUF3857 [Pedobacter psychrotolerans]|uniref:Uncharacterized protein DUF3857 n=1 Tax=Pedobacter psychrotolerans TaxID=1843235 RepID=A0A4R2HCT0_9SPHI|nr:DUF3857 domain-containing protein [Pedobacter psychrotolerans]TCO25041.1 uncharacterized protein DUF3857 [Pedobacter psychrotolerans]GGE48572.1 hypothetical protein GCM10011413_13320 [Pedobacter psychrotolerans]